MSVAWGVIPREDFAGRHSFLQGWLAAEFFVPFSPCVMAGHRGEPGERQVGAGAPLPDRHLCPGGVT